MQKGGPNKNTHSHTETPKQKQNVRMLVNAEVSGECQCVRVSVYTTLQKCVSTHYKLHSAKNRKNANTTRNP